MGPREDALLPQAAAASLGGTPKLSHLPGEATGERGRLASEPRPEAACGSVIVFFPNRPNISSLSVLLGC